MSRRLFLIPVIGSHFGHTKFRLASGAGIRLIDQTDLWGLFNGSPVYSCEDADFLLCTCRDLLEGSKNLVLVIEDESMDFEEFRHKASACAREVALKFRLFSGSDISVNNMSLFCNDSPVCAGVISLMPMPACGAANILDLDDNSVASLQKFIDVFDIKSCSRKLHEAIHMFEHSFSAEDPGVRVVLLLTALELLFAFETNEDLRYCVARNTAAFISGDAEEFRENFKTVRNLYKSRSKYAHSGKTKDLIPENVAALQRLLSRVLLKYIDAEKTSQITQDMLAERFGSAG